MDVPRDLPSRLSGAFLAVGLPWPDVRIGHFDGVLGALGEHAQAPRLREHVGRLRTIQEAFFGHLGELADDHGDDPMRLARHRDEPCVRGVRDDWAETAALMPGFHAALTTFVRELLGGPREVPDYLAAAPAWVETRPGRGIRDEPTAGRAPAAGALLRWREDPYGPRVCVVTGSPAAGKTRLLSWFGYAGVWDWSGYPGSDEAAILLRGMDVDDAVRDLAGQLKLDGAALDAIDRPVLVTVADTHRGNDPERAFTELVLPLAVNPHVRLLVELTRPDAEEGLGPAAFVLDLDDPRATDRAAFTAWYDAERVPRSPFTAGQVYPSPGIAALAARAEGADPGPDLPIDGRVARAWLAGLSPDARAAAGTLALAFGPIGPYTWRLLHCGRHRDAPEAAARGVAEAAARLPLAEPGLPAYAIGLPCLAEMVAPPAEAHGELAAVMRGWPVSAELSPPDYLTRHLAHHERLAGGPDTVTPLPLRRPATRVTRELLDDLYGQDGVFRPADGGLHPAIAHAPTRRFLTEVGLPAGGLHEPGWTGERRRFAQPMSEYWSDGLDELRACPGLPDDLGALFMLDAMDTWYLFLDGRTGLVYEVHEALESARVAHRHVESYAYFVYVVHRERRLWCEGRDAHREAAYWCADDLALELHTYEPEAMAGEDALWPPTLEDYTLLT